MMYPSSKFTVRAHGTSLMFKIEGILYCIKFSLSICVGPGKSNLPFELRRKAGDCSRVTAGPIDLI